MAPIATLLLKCQTLVTKCLKEESKLTDLNLSFTLYYNTYSQENNNPEITGFNPRTYMSQNGHIHSKHFAANAVRLLKCV